MTTSRLVGAEIQRRSIPQYWQLTFVEVTNAELASMTTDQKLSPTVRAYAVWELEYRMAAGVEVVYDEQTDAIERLR